MSAYQIFSKTLRRTFQNVSFDNKIINLHFKIPAGYYSSMRKLYTFTVLTFRPFSALFMIIRYYSILSSLVYTFRKFYITFSENTFPKKGKIKKYILSFLSKISD